MSPFRTALLFSFAALLCIFTLPYLPIDLTPSRASYSITIQFSGTDQPPLVTEAQITSVIEAQVSQLEGLTKIRSSSGYGSGWIELTFGPQEDMAFREAEIYAILRRCRALLPPEVGMPSVTRAAKQDKEASPLLIYELTYTTDDLTANQWLNTYLLPRIGAHSGLEKVAVNGMRQYAWKVSYWYPTLVRYGITPSHIQQKLQETFSQQDLGALSQNHMLVPFRYLPAFTHADDLANLYITPDLKLRDVTDVSLVADRVMHYLRINGQRAVFISCYAHPGQNRLQVAEEVTGSVAYLQQELPSGYTLRLNHDDSAFIKREINKTALRAALSVIVIMLFLLVAGRNPRYLLALGSCITITLLITIGLAWMFQLQVDLYSLAGITIAAGLVVDNAIVVTDHIRRFKNLSILPAQLAASLTTLAALLVIFSLPESYRASLGSFAAVLGLAIGVSFFTGWWLSPALASVCGLHNLPDSSATAATRLLQVYRRLIAFLSSKKKMVIIVCILGFGLPIFLLPARWAGHDWYNKTLGNDTYVQEVRPYLNKTLGGSLRLFYQNVYEKSFYRSPEQTQLYVTAKLPYGHTLAQMNDVMAPVEAYLSQFSEIDKYLTRVYSARYASIQITFTKSHENGNFPYLLKSKLTQRAINWGGVTWGIYGVGKGFSNASGGTTPSFRVLLSGYHYDMLGDYADQLAEMLLKHPRVQEVNTNAQLSWEQESFYMYRFKPLPERMRFGNFFSSVALMQHQAPVLMPSMYINYQNKLMPVYVESDDAHRFSIHQAKYQGFDHTPMGYFGDMTLEKQPDAVIRENRQYIRSVNFDYYGSYRFGDKYLDEVLSEFKQILPPGFSAKKSEWTWDRSEEKRKYSLLIIMAVGIFFIGSIFLENFKQALLLVAIIPLSYIGLFLIFAWGSFSFDQGGYAAFLMVGGLSVNALLYVLSDYKNNLKNMSSNDALLMAVHAKTGPVLMTILSTCMGLIPFLIHGDSEIFWFSFAIGTIGGMLFSILVVFIIMPVLLWKHESSNASIP